MADFKSIQMAYELRLRRLFEELSAEVEPDEEKQRQLAMLHGLAAAVVQAYGAHQRLSGEHLESSTSVMYAADAAKAGGGGVLNVPLRSLVENNTVRSWQARFLNSSLTTKRTILITGPPDSGRSTLLNSLVQLITVDQRIVAIEGGATLPALRERSFTVRISAQPGTPSFAEALEKGAAMRPTWILAEHAGRSDGPAFLKTLAAGFSGLATIDSPDPELALSDWIINNAEAASFLQKIVPLIVHMDRDPGGRPRALKIFEAGVDEQTGKLVLTERRAD